MKLNATKTKTMIISRSRTLLPSFPNLVLDGTVLEESSILTILGVTLDSKLTFEYHVRSLAKSVSQKLGIMRRVWRVFGDQRLLIRCFRCFVLPILEYGSPVWGSAASSYLKILDRVVRSARFISGDGVICDLEHRRDVAASCMLYKIWCNHRHPLYDMLPEPHVVLRETRGAFSLHQHAFKIPRCKTDQFQRSLIPRMVRI